MVSTSQSTLIDRRTWLQGCSTLAAGLFTGLIGQDFGKHSTGEIINKSLTPRELAKPEVRQACEQELELGAGRGLYKGGTFGASSGYLLSSELIKYPIEKLIKQVLPQGGVEELTKKYNWNKFLARLSQISFLSSSVGASTNYLASKGTANKQIQNPTERLKQHLQSSRDIDTVSSILAFALLGGPYTAYQWALAADKEDAHIQLQENIEGVWKEERHLKSFAFTDTQKSLFPFLNLSDLIPQKFQRMNQIFEAELEIQPEEVFSDKTKIKLKLIAEFQKNELGDLELELKSITTSDGTNQILERKPIVIKTSLIKNLRISPVHFERENLPAG